MLKAGLALLVLSSALAAPGAPPDASAQSGQKARPRPAAQEPAPAPPAPAQKKATARPTEGAEQGNAGPAPQPGPPARAAAVKEDPNAPRFAYHFSQPDFIVHTIHIEHDEAGRGQIRFERRSDVEQLTEPFQLSPAALERIKAHWAALDYLGSAESYQSARDHSNLGRTRLSVRRGGRERAAEFNYSDAADAQALASEYRRAAEQAILVFELSVALESQPLEMPKLINKLDHLIKSNFLSDPKQLAPLLRQLIEDERVPLVGRNQAERIVKRLEK
ncbi:MAG TPA: hypothetical protein VEY09_04635 [Pyrinomonadaceae bacterium]|nr:hypothetical protein [Pyrinomonadaceae bacterium]